MPNRVASDEQRPTDDEERLSLAYLVTHVAELSQPGIMEVIDLEVVQRPHETGQRGIEFEESDKRKEQR